MTQLTTHTVRRRLPQPARVAVGSTALWTVVTALVSGESLLAIAVGLLSGLLTAAAVRSPARSRANSAPQVATSNWTIWAALAASAPVTILAVSTNPKLLVVVFVGLVATWIMLNVESIIEPPVVKEPAIDQSGGSPSSISSLATRSLDIAVASIVLVLTLPLLGIVAIAIYLEDHGPIFFSQPRVGKNESEFRVFKFRSMYTDAEERKADIVSLNQRNGPLFKISDDPRVTKVGKVIRELSLDELPQLVNVIVGHMSLVGPRPALLDEAEEFDQELKARTAVRPGISGLWQVEARNNPDFELYRSYDLAYVNQHSFALDVSILGATAALVLRSVLARPLTSMGYATSGNDCIDLRASTDLRTTTGLRTSIDLTASLGLIDGVDSAYDEMVIDLRDHDDFPLANHG